MPEDDRNEPRTARRGDDGPTFDDPPSTTEVGFALAEKVVGGRFKLGERLSWGGMGTIYRALDLVTQREVAVKIPHLGDPLNDARFQAESEAVRSVVAPMVCSSVIGYVAHGDAEDEPFLAMELVTGHPLWRHLQRGALDIEASFGVGRRIASALAAIHLGGWIHRDIKPGNVVVAPDGSVKLLDFGLSRPIDGDGSGTQTGQLVGTLGYMAPEQFAGGSSIDPRTDVYALAVVLFECLTGRRAFKRTLAEVVAKAPEDVLDVRGLRLSPAYTSVLERCLARAPAARPNDGLEMLVALLAARDARFDRFLADGGAYVDVARHVMRALLRGGAARVDGDVGATSMLTEVLAELVAPSVVLRVACDPRLTSTPLAHAAAIADAIAAAGQPSLAARLHPRSRGPSGDATDTEIVRSVIVIVEDATWCDSATVERLGMLAADRALYVVFASSFDQIAPPAAEACPRERIVSTYAWTTSTLDPMARWCLRAASMFGRRFPAGGVEELVAGDEAKELDATFARVRDAGWIEPAAPPPRTGAESWFRFASGAALEAARSLAAPHERRLGARLAAEWEGPSVRGPEIARVVTVDVACASLAPPPS